MNDLMKAVTPGRSRNLLQGGVGWLAGYVVRSSDVARAHNVRELHAELGLAYPGSPFQADGEYLDVLRIPSTSYTALRSPGAPDTAPSQQPTDWTRLYTLLGGSHAAAANVELAAADPQVYFDRFEDDLFQRGIEEPEWLSPWIALIDALSEEEVVAYLDWKASGADLVDALGDVQSFAGETIDLSEVAVVQGDLTKAIARANEILAAHALRVLQLEEDSDSYPLVVVQEASAQEIVALAAKLGFAVHTHD